jgi:hypothetical protein
VNNSVEKTTLLRAAARDGMASLFKIDDTGRLSLAARPVNGNAVMISGFLLLARRTSECFFRVPLLDARTPKTIEVSAHTFPFEFDAPSLQPVRFCICEITKDLWVPVPQDMNDVANRESIHKEASRKPVR